MAISEAFNMDCMEYMKTIPDKHFDLAVVDPPYGGGGAALTAEQDSAEGLTVTSKIARTGGKWAAKFGKK